MLAARLTIPPQTTVEGLQESDFHQAEGPACLWHSKHSLNEFQSFK
jgi:hypothetical protein